MKSVKKGFTLIELLIVVVIIGILAAIAIPKFANTKEKAYLTAMKSDLRNLVTAEEAYFAEWATYTSALTSTQYRNSTGVSLLGITPTTGGFSASVDYAGGTTKTCQITVGSGSKDGEPVCDP
jgi:type IV pilus assembly protein PilA